MVLADENILAGHRRRDQQALVGVIERDLAAGIGDKAAHRGQDGGQRVFQINRIADHLAHFAQQQRLGQAAAHLLLHAGLPQCEGDLPGGNLQQGAQRGVVRYRVGQVTFQYADRGVGPGHQRQRPPAADTLAAGHVAPVLRQRIGSRRLITRIADRHNHQGGPGAGHGRLGAGSSGAAPGACPARPLAQTAGRKPGRIRRSPAAARGGTGAALVPRAAPSPAMVPGAPESAARSCASASCPRQMATRASSASLMIAAAAAAMVSGSRNPASSWLRRTSQPRSAGGTGAAPSAAARADSRVDRAEPFVAGQSSPEDNAVAGEREARRLDTIGNPSATVG